MPPNIWLRLYHKYRRTKFAVNLWMSEVIFDSWHRISRLDKDLRLSLFRPYPWHFPVTLPDSPNSIRANIEARTAYLDQIYLMHPVWLFRWRDTPIRCLYRIYELMILEDRISVGYEAQYFWSQPSWKLNSIPDPHDPDPARTAALAGIIDIMVLTFNNRHDMGLPRMMEGLAAIYARRRWDAIGMDEVRRLAPNFYESAPLWVKALPPLLETAYLLDLPLERATHPFRKRNVVLVGGDEFSWI